MSITDETKTTGTSRDTTGQVLAPGARALRQELFSDELLDQMLLRVDEDGVALTGRGGFLPELVKAVLERGMDAELTSHLGYERGDRAGHGSGNSRNSPLHYMELPELFMEFISSMTGKSPSTTGAGSEGALTKGPFNAMPAIIDLNASLLSYVLTGSDGWVSAAGYVGPHVRVDHDFSLLVPELFSRMTPHERDARNLIGEGALEKLSDFEHDGRRVPASRLGYRMTDRLATKYFGRIFLHPDVVFTPQMLRPELQDVGIFAESIATIVTTHQRVARSYFQDGTITLAVPPLRALLEIMAEGFTAAGCGLDSPEFRVMFTREAVLASDWYAQRLDAKQAAARARANAGLAAIEKFVCTAGNEEPAARLDMPARVQAARVEAQRLASPAFRKQLIGTAGSTPL